MLTVVERVLLLQDVDVFQDATSEQVALVAAIATEQAYPEKATVYQQDELADAMYVVVRGLIRLHRGDTEVAQVGSNEAFGTWALFQVEPRLTAATAMERTLLLRIEREDFIEVLADHVDVTRAILGSVARRLRALLGRSATGGG